MDAVVLFNGLGNQMSQYAFYLAQKQQGLSCVCFFESSSSSMHNGFELQRIFGIRIARGVQSFLLNFLLRVARSKHFKWISRLIGIQIISEPLNYDFTSSLLKKGGGLLNFYIGGWHSPLYYKNIKEEIQTAFTFPSQEHDMAFMEWKTRIENKEQTSISLHIRRGDYLDSKPEDYYQFGNVATVEYYRSAINYLRSRISDCHFFVFSNDLIWCKKEFGTEGFSYVDCNTGLLSWRDMYLMSLCRHHINANSTFSWWGAWLSPYTDTMTIRPRWFIRDIETKDFYPTHWINAEFLQS